MARPYEQRARAESAQQTRRRIFEAVHHALADTTSGDVTVDDIARRADVGRSTIYAAFGDRAGLFDAFAEDLLRRSGLADVLAAADGPDARAAAVGTVRATVRLYAADADVLRALYSLSRLDPGAFGGTMLRLEAGRAIGMRQLAARLANEQALRPGITESDAQRALWVLTAFETFDLLADRSSPDATDRAEALARFVEHALFDEP